MSTALGVRSGPVAAAAVAWCGGRTESLVYAPVRRRWCRPLMSAVHRVRVRTEFQSGGRTVGPLPPDVLVGAAPDQTAGTAVVLVAVTKRRRAGLQRATALGTGWYGVGRHPCNVPRGSDGRSHQPGKLTMEPATRDHSPPQVSPRRSADADQEC